MISRYDLEESYPIHIFVFLGLIQWESFGMSPLGPANLKGYKMKLRHLVSDAIGLIAIVILSLSPLFM